MQGSARNQKRPSWIQVIAICLAVAAVTMLATGYVLSERYEARQNSAQTGISYRKLDEIRSLIDAYYVGEYEEDELLDMLSVGYMSGINDKWSYYTNAENLQALYEDKSGSYAGIGVTVTLDAETGLLQVMDVYEGSPAAEAGIRRFDMLYTVEGESVAAIGMDATVAKVRGEIGTTVNLEILRDGVVIAMTVERRTVEKTSVYAELINGEIGFLRISEFTVAAATQFAETLATLQNIGAKNVIIDVRNNPGGQLSTLIKMLDELMPEGEVFIERDKAGNENRLSVDAEFCDIPVVVLVNEYSYSAAEYFAAVMQEQGRAYVIGSPTTGKGEGQQTFQLSDGSAITFSVIKYFTPNGVSIGDKGGIVPDMNVEITYDQITVIGTVDYRDDPQIMAAVGYMQELMQQ